MGLKKEIIQLKDGKEVAKYASATDAAKAIGSIKSNISKCCLGKLKQVNGFTFQYSGNYTNKHSNDGDLKCPYCDFRCNTYNGLAKHNLNSHGNISKEQFLADFAYNGVIPKCSCGCDEYVSISYEGGVHFNEYIRGHHARVCNNWGHNKDANTHSSETRRKQYSGGERIQWNKGKKWSEVYDDVTQEKLKSNIISKLKDRIINNKFSLSSKIENGFIESVIIPLKLPFIKQFYLKDIKQFCDVYIEKLNLIIECDGSYWHCNKEFFPQGSENDFQEKKIEKDKLKNDYCIENNINIFRFWDTDYINERKSVVDNLLCSIEAIKRGEKVFVFDNDFNYGEKEINNEIANTLDLSEYQSDNIKIKVFPLSSKTKMFTEKEREEKHGKKLICIFEDELKYKNDIVKNRLDSIFGKYNTKLYARKCEVREILAKDSFDFISKYHIQGYANAKNSIGLFYNNELVSVMTFGSLRKNLGSKSIDGEYEMIRYCSKPKTLIVGGASKMLKYFERKYNPTRIISYCDKRWSNGNLYYSLGFDLDHVSKPNYFYVRDGKRENRFKYRKDVLVKEGYDKNKTEEEIMEERGIKRVYDCGCYVFEKNNF